MRQTGCKKNFAARFTLLENRRQNQIVIVQIIEFGTDKINRIRLPAPDLSFRRAWQFDCFTVLYGFRFRSTIHDKRNGISFRSDFGVYYGVAIYFR